MSENANVLPHDTPQAVPEAFKQEVAAQAESFVEEIVGAMILCARKSMRCKPNERRDTRLMKRFLTDKRISSELVFRAATDRLTLGYLTAAYTEWLEQMKALGTLERDFLCKATRTHADHLYEDEGATSSFSSEFLRSCKKGNIWSVYFPNVKREDVHLLKGRHLPLRKMPAAARAAAEAAAAEAAVAAGIKVRNKKKKRPSLQRLKERLMRLTARKRPRTKKAKK